MRAFVSYFCVVSSFSPKPLFFSLFLACFGLRVTLFPIPFNGEALQRRACVFLASCQDRFFVKCFESPLFFFFLFFSLSLLFSLLALP